MSETLFPVPVETWDVFGPHLRCLTHLSGREDDFCLLEGELSQGMFVPVHSHEDRECFLVLAGDIEAWIEGRWTSHGEGEVVEVAGGRRHAWRKATPGTALLLIATTVRLGRFLREAGRPLAAAHLPPTPAELQRFAVLAHRYGHWLGTPEDNAAAGLTPG